MKKVINISDGLLWAGVKLPFLLKKMRKRNIFWKSAVSIFHHKKLIICSQGEAVKLIREPKKDQYGFVFACMRTCISS